MSKQRHLIVHFYKKDTFNEFFEKQGINNYNSDIVSVFVDSNKKLKNLVFKKHRYQKKINKPKKEWQYHWTDIYEFNIITKDVLYYATVEFIFSDKVSLKDISEMFYQEISNNTKSIIYPKNGVHQDVLKRCVSSNINPKYPIYIISKGRSDCCITADNLIKMGIPFHIVIEKSEWEDYKKYYDESILLELNMKFKDEYETYISNFDETKSKGSGPARNFVWDHAKKSGAKFHWIMDDNINGFYIFEKDYRCKVCDGGILAATENFIDRYDNIGISGLNYRMFVIPGCKDVPYVTNSKIYSCLLIRNNLPIRWAGRYNEDVDLCLRALKEGFSTIQFDAFMANKISTQQMGGGNTEAFYAEEGTLPKSKQLQSNHPDLTKIVWRFSRWHHLVNYSIFNRNKNRSIKQTLIDISQKQILSKNSHIIDKIRDIDLRSEICYDDLFKTENKIIRDKVIDYIKKYRYKIDNDFIIEQLIKEPIINISGLLFFDTLSEDEKIAKILLELPFDIVRTQRDIEVIKKSLSFVDSCKLKKILKEIIRNKYIKKTKYNIVDFDFKFLFISEEEHKEKRDSKVYLYKTYLGIDIGEEPITTQCKLARGEIQRKRQKDFKNQLTKRGENKISVKNKKLFCIIGDENFTDEKKFNNYMQKLNLKNNKIALIHGVTNKSDLFFADFGLKNKFETFEFVPDFNLHGIYAEEQNNEEMIKKCDYGLMFLHRNNNDKKYIKLINRIKKEEKVKVIYYGEKQINLNNIF